MKRDPAKDREWRERGARRYQEKQRTQPRKRLNPASTKRAAENRERRKVLRDHYGTHPRCHLCEPLRAHGIETGCNGWADDGDEWLRRSAGGSITDVTNVRPVGRLCHRWATEHPKAMRDWGLEGSRYGGVA